MERQPPSTLAGFRTSADPRTATLLDVPFNKRDSETHALKLIGPGMIVGIVVGALVVVSAVNDDDDGGGSGY
jgi:SOS-response transcriptional repressor LexA